MTDQPIGPKPIPEGPFKGSNSLAYTNVVQAPAMPHDLHIMRIAARAVLDEVKRLADELPPFVALAPADIVRTTVKFIDADGLALRLFESQEADQ